MKRICVFCGSSPSSRPEYVQVARRLAHILVDRGIGLVYGGASVGLMGEIADAVLREGGEVTGVIPEMLLLKELAHPDLSELVVVNSMHQRKLKMSELSDGFIALPGGFGTMEEFFEVLTWAQLGLHQKPCGILDVADYYRHLVSFMDHMLSEGFLKDKWRNMVLIDTDPLSLLDRFDRYVPPEIGKWLSPERT
ncbi:MAG: TIGR00730 family Rossman fold protein [Acidobacteriota bacterium]